MEEIIVKLEKTYPVIIGDAFVEIEQRLTSDSVIITDENLKAIYSNRIDAYRTIVIPAGEESKNWNTIERVFREMIELGITRNSFILGFGGGVVCDIAGFVASTFMRGCRFGLVATSLLSQVDAAIGGKNGFNFDGIKNLIGIIKQPEFVVCDTLLLKTLPEDELKSGLGEVIKYALIADPKLFQYLNTNAQEILDLQTKNLEHIIESCVYIKAGYIEQDESDMGIRHHLNFGHTFGHAIEQIEQLPHGVAVAKGMLIIARISVILNISSSDIYHKLIKLFNVLGLPIDYSLHPSMMSMIRNDKKKINNQEINLILIKDIGETEIHNTKFDDLEKLLEEL